MRTTDVRRLIDQAVAGDKVALERLLLDSYRPLSDFISARMPPALRDGLSVDDVLQQTFLSAFRAVKGATFPSPDAFTGWLRTLAQNCLFDESRRHQRKKRGGERKRVRQRNDQASSLRDLLDVALGTSDMPSRLAARREAIQALQVALAQLSDGYREVLSLTYLQGKSLDEVARHMNRTPDAIRGLLHRAKKELRAAMGRSSLYLSR